MNSKTKTEKTDSLLRVPKAKNKLGLKIPKIAMPHDDLIVADKLRFEVVPNKSQEFSMPSQSSHTRQTSQGSMTRQSIYSENEIAPTKNYQKVANSITKQAIPEGFFKGKDKHLYDVLYSLTRGSIEPKRSVRISKTKLMKMASIGSRITFDSCIGRLETVGLLILTIFTGEHDGNEFEILLPEEIESLTSHTTMTSQTSHAQKLDRVLILETSQTSHSLNPINTTTSSEPKTSLKTNTTDDESETAFSEFVEKVSAACKRITGKPVSRQERKKWGMLADLLILEFESAARRADSISSAPAFLTEVLRRKLLSVGANSREISPAKSPKSKIDIVGKPDEAGEYEKKPLDDKGRENALAQLQEFAGEDFLQDFRKWYTEEDWKWLINQLEKDRKSVN
jgi:hypothetical protein